MFGILDWPDEKAEKAEFRKIKNLSEQSWTKIKKIPSTWFVRTEPMRSTVGTDIIQEVVNIWTSLIITD